MKLTTTTIFKNDFIEVVFTGTDAKDILINTTAENPIDGKIYTQSAGWISKTWYLHSNAKTPGYIFEKAAHEYHENLFKIAEKLLIHLKKLRFEFVEKEKDEDVERIEIDGSTEPKYGMCDVLRYAYKTMGENLELIKREREENKFVKVPSQKLTKNKRRVSR